MSSTPSRDDAGDDVAVDEPGEGEVRWPSAERYARLDDDGLVVWRSSTGHRERRSYDR